MKFAIVESGGKQYRAVEGSTIEVDRLPVEPGNKIDIENILLMADDGEVLVGTPTVSGMRVQATVLDHFKGPKLVRFRYRPKKRIRVKGGYRHQYTRLMVDFIGKAYEERMASRAAEPQLEEAEGGESSQSSAAGQWSGEGSEKETRKEGFRQKACE